MIGAPPKSAVAAQRAALEAARRRTALQVDTLAHAVVDMDDAVGWARLTELGTRSTVVAQESAVSATADLLNATLNAADLVGDIASLPGIQPGRLASGNDVRGMFAATRDIVARRMTAPDVTFPMALDASASKLVAIASSEPHRIGRDGQLAVGLSDDRFNRYRRVAVGNTCAFCLMLATRGAVYLTAASAGQSRKYHAHCDCYVELVVDQDAIARSQALQGDWRNAIRDPAGRMEPVGAWRAVDMPAPVVEQVAEVAPPLAPRFTAESAQRLTNADLEREMSEAWGRADDDLATLLEDEMERRSRWATDWGRTYDEYDDWRPLDPTDLDDADLPDFEDIPQRTLSRREIRAEWEAEQETRYWDAEAYGAGIRPDMATEAQSKGITLRDLMTGDPRTAYKYANQELLTWWDRNGGRMPLYERMAAHGHLDKRTSLGKLRLTEDKARALAQELIGKDRREAMARRGAEQARTRRASGRGATESDRLAAAQRRYQRAQRMASQ